MLNNSAVPTVELEQPLFWLRTDHIFLENEENVLRESGVSIGIDLLQNNSEALEVAQEALFVFMSMLSSIIKIRKIEYYVFKKVRSRCYTQL